MESTPAFVKASPISLHDFYVLQPRSSWCSIVRIISSSSETLPSRKRGINSRPETVSTFLYANPPFYTANLSFLRKTKRNNNSNNNNKFLRRVRRIADCNFFFNREFFFKCRFFFNRGYQNSSSNADCNFFSIEDTRILLHMFKKKAIQFFLSSPFFFYFENSFFVSMSLHKYINIRTRTQVKEVFSRRGGGGRRMELLTVA